MLRGDRCLMWGNRRSGFVGVEGAIVVCWGIGDRVFWVLRGDRCLIWNLGDRVLWVVRVRSLFYVGNRRSV